jgi:hypothetical protein
VKAEAEKPQHENDYKDCPKHELFSLGLRFLGSTMHMVIFFTSYIFFSLRRVPLLIRIVAMHEASSTLSAQGRAV